MLPLPCMLVCTFVCANRTRDRGCSQHPVFPAPSDQEGGKFQPNLAQMMREIANAYSVAIVRLDRATQYSRDSSD